MNCRTAVLIVLALALAALAWAQKRQPAQKAQPAPAGQSSQPVAKQPQFKSKPEQEAFVAIINAPDAAARVKAVDTFLVTYADTEFKATALLFGAMTYQQMNDFDNMIIYAERTLEADPKNAQAMLMLAGGIAQRTREFDLDREEKLTRAEKYAHGAEEALKTALKPNPNLTDEQWEAVKKDSVAQAHEALGQVAKVRKNYDLSIAELKTALEVASSPHNPATMFRLGQVYNLAGKYDEAMAILEKIMALSEEDPQTKQPDPWIKQIKQYAQAERARAFQLKAAAAKPAAPAPPATIAPAQIEIKKP